MAQALAIRHVHFEDVGTFAAVLAGRGYDVGYVEAGCDDLDRIDPLAPDLLIVLGGPIGAYEDDAFPVLVQEHRLVGARLAARRPTLGVCLGAQIMARTLGARVAPGPVKEIGWSRLALSQAGRASPLRHLDGVEVLHWHGDTFDLPAGATLLASSDHYAMQAFACGDWALGLQFHVEVEAAGLERWYIGHAAELGQAGIDVPALRAAGVRHAAALGRAGRALLEDWLEGLG